MIRTLFREEFIRGMLKALLGASLGAVLSIITGKVFEWMAPDPMEAQSAIEGISVFCILVFAAGCGSMVFSRQFREGPLRLIEVLPIGRAWIWLIRVSTGFATTVTVTALLVLAQPTLIGRHSLPVVLAVASFALLLFAAGCCMSTLTSLPHLVTTILAAAVSFGILFVFIAAQVYVSTGGPSGTQLEGPFTSPIMGIILPPVFLLFSLAVFGRGELETRRRRWRNTLLGTGLLFATLFLTISALDAGAFERGSAWKTSDLIRVSEDGVYVSAIQFKGQYSLAFRLAIVEIATGNLLKTYEGRSWAGQVWTEDGALIVFTKDSALRYLLGFGSESVNAVRVFPSQQPLFRLKGYRLTASTADRRGALLLLEEAPSLGGPSHYTVRRMDSAGGARELIRIPRRGSYFAWLERAYDGSVFTIFPDRHWQVREDVVEMSASLGHFRFLSTEALQRASASLASGTPPAGPRALPGKYLLSDRTLDFNESIWLYYMQADPLTRRGSLWARRNGATEWKEVLKDIPFSDLQVKGLALKTRELFAQPHPDIVTRTRSGIVTWLDSTAAQPQLTVFDLNSGERFDMGDVGITPGKGPLRVNITAFSGSRFVITVLRLDKGRFSYMPGAFYYEPGKGAPVRWTEPAIPNILFVDEGGGYLYGQGSSETGFQLLYAKPPAKPRILFPIP